MKSMTGYGRAVCEENDVHVEVEIRTVNGRSFCLSTKIPPELAPYEMEMKQFIAQKITRGSVTLSIVYQDEEAVIIHLNERLLVQYYQELARVATILNVPPPSLEAIIHVPDMIQPLAKKPLSSERQSKIYQVLASALDQLEAMRQKEGAKLGAEIGRYCTELQQGVASLEKLAPDLVANYRDKLHKRLQELSQNQEKFQFTESDILREVAIFSERVDISEELTRLKSHLTQLEELLDKDQDIGKTVEFLLQEMVRESNTISSKANDATCSKIIIQLKSLLEKIREQIQNVT